MKKEKLIPVINLTFQLKLLKLNIIIIFLQIV